MPIDQGALDGQREHWEGTFAKNRDMYGTGPSDPARFAIDMLERASSRDVLELGAGQGRDTLAFLAAGFNVTALDYAADALDTLQKTAEQRGFANRLTTLAHDVRHPLPLPSASMDAAYSHMLFSMALSTSELDDLAREVHRVLRPGGMHIFTVRHVGDAHHRAGIPHGDGMFEHGGFVVHFFDDALVDRLAAGFSLVDRADFEEGELPRKLWRITLRKERPSGNKRRTIDEILNAARARLERLEPELLQQAQTDGALIVDTRPVEQRLRDGELPGAVVIDRNVLEWRLDPACDHHIAEVTGYDTHIVIVCNEGYSSSLAAAQLQDLGLHRATDLIGGFQAYLRTYIEGGRT